MTIYKHFRRHSVTPQDLNRRAKLFQNRPLQYTSYVLKTDSFSAYGSSLGYTPEGDNCPAEFDFEGHVYVGMHQSAPMLGFAPVENSFSMRDLSYNPKTQRIIS